MLGPIFSCLQHPHSLTYLDDGRPRRSNPILDSHRRPYNHIRLPTHPRQFQSRYFSSRVQLWTGPIQIHRIMQHFHHIVDPTPRLTKRQQRCPDPPAKGSQSCVSSRPRYLEPLRRESTSSAPIQISIGDSAFLELRRWLGALLAPEPA